MQIKAVYFLSAASVALAATLMVPGSSAQAGECLTAPKGAAPAGSHWRYRTDHVAKKNCWYLKAETKSAAPTETADASGGAAGAEAAPAPAKPAAASAALRRPATRVTQSAETSLQPAVANARAEIEAPAAQASSQPTEAAAAPDPAFPPPAPMQNDNPVATQTNPSSQIDQRWSDAAAGTQQTGEAAVAARLRSSAQEAAARTSADSASAVAGQSTTTLILALLAALALAGAIVGAIVRFSGSEPIVQRRGGRRDIWGDAGVDPAPEPPMDLGQPPRWIQAARQRQSAVDDTDEIEHLLARAKADERLAAHHPN